MTLKHVLEVLQKQVHAESGIPPLFQRLYYKNRFIKDPDSLRAVPNEATLMLHIGLHALRHCVVFVLVRFFKKSILHSVTLKMLCSLMKVVIGVLQSTGLSGGQELNI